MAASSIFKNLFAALPFWVSLLLVPIVWLSAVLGGGWVVLVPVTAISFFAMLDAILGLNLANKDPDTPQNELTWYRAITLIWTPIQFVTLFGLIWYATRAPHLGGVELAVLFFGVGVITGTIGINYAHEMMHQADRRERLLGDILLAMVLYSHFRSEHLLVHHIYVGTPRDPVTARYNESFHRFFPRVLRQSLVSSFKAEAQMLRRRGRSWRSLSNPFYRYWALQGVMILLALGVGGWTGLILFVWQAFIAVWYLELVNYVEHYGLTRKHLGQGKYEHVQPHHSWNAAHRATNWLLINLQRHSDHHYKPSRRFPLLQTYDDATAPQLPHSYPIMTVLALLPRQWRRVMNPRVRRWRTAHYPEITDWAPYNSANHPMPR